jgi:hypothetical protein
MPENRTKWQNPKNTRSADDYCHLDFGQLNISAEAFDEQK